MSATPAAPARIYTAPDAAPTLAVPSEVPVTLLPLRIETRFVRRVSDPWTATLEAALAELGGLTVASPELPGRLSVRMGELAAVAADHRVRRVATEATYKLEQKAVAADLALAKSKKMAPVVSPERAARVAELETALALEKERQAERQRLATLYTAALSRLAKAATPAGLLAARRAAVTTGLGEIAARVGRLGAERRLRNLHGKLDLAQIKADVAALDGAVEALAAELGLDVLLAELSALQERLGRVESWLARAAPGPDPVRLALRASKGFRRLADSAWAGAIQARIAKIPTPKTGTPSEPLARQLADAGTYTGKLVRAVTTLPTTPGWVDPPRGPSEPGGTGGTPGTGTTLPVMSDWELQIRVYPDEIAIDRLEPRLSADEIAAGRAYWIRQRAAGGDEALALGAWRGLVARYGSRRGSWIARQTRPLDRPTRAETIPDRRREAVLRLRAERASVATAKAETSRIAAVKSPMSEALSATATLSEVVTAETTENVADELTFPEPATRAPGEHRVPAVTVLPERLLFRLTPRVGSTFSSAQFLGEAIPASLTVGIDPSEAVLNQAGAFVGNEALRWMVDFEEAVRVGMAVRIALPWALANPASPTCGFSRVEVIGVRQGTDPARQDATSALEALFGQHPYTGLGMSILPQGTPTNTTSEADSGYDLGEPDPRRSQALLSPQFTARAALGERADGEHLARALGLRLGVFQHIEGAAGADIATALAMNTALWHGTFGQHMEDMLYVEHRAQRALITTELLDATRDFQTKNVLGRGRIPVLRVGRQPYGVLPMTNLNQAEWEPGSGWRNDLYRVLNRLRKGHSVQYSSSGVQHVLSGAESWLSGGETVADPLRASETAQDRFMQLLGLQATSAELLHRYGIIVPSDASYTQFKDFVDDLGATWPAVLKAYNDLFTGPSYIVGEAMAALLGETDTALFTARGLSPLRSYAPLGTRVDDAPANALSWLLTATPAALMTAVRQGQEPSRSVLYLLARKAMLQAFWDAAARVWEAASLIDGLWSWVPDEYPCFLPPTTLGQLPQIDPDAAWCIDSDAVARDGIPASTLAIRCVVGLFRRGRYKEFVTDQLSFDAMGNSVLTPGPLATKRYFLELPTSLLGPSGTSEPLHARLHRAVTTGGADPLSGHLTGLRETRAALRVLQDRPARDLDLALREHLDTCAWRLDAWYAGLCFSRLDEQRTRAARSLVGAFGWVEDLRPAGAPVNHGHIHAPSLHQALTGAVLRAAQVGGDGDISAVNLSSQRVRLATGLLDGMRAGQGLPELLGALLERRMHAINPALNRFVPGLRARYSGAPAFGRASAVTDGLALARAHRAGSPVPLDGAPAPSAAELAHFEEAVSDVHAALDAVGDLLLAEATFQVTRGNFDRAAAALAVLSAGQIPPEPEVVKTPTQTVPLEHRVGLCLHPATPASGALGRALAEPTLEAWLDQILGDRAKIRFCYTVNRADGTRQRGEAGVDALGLGATDLVMLLGAGGLGPASELAGWATVHAASVQPATRSGAVSPPTFHVDFARREPAWATDVHTLQDTLPLARCLYRLIAAARPLRAGDLSPSSALDGLDTDGIARLRIGELVARVDAVRTTCGGLRDQLASLRLGESALLSTRLPASNAGLCVSLLLQLARFALPQALPVEPALLGTDRESYLERVRALALGVLDPRLAAFDKARAQLVPGLAVARQAEIAVTAIRELLGRDFQICPLFDAHAPSELRAAADHPPRLPSVLSRDEWLHGVSLVRRNVLSLEQSNMFAAMWRDGAESSLDTNILQLPYTADEPWLGLRFDPTLVPLDRERLSLVMLLPAAFSPEAQPCCGLLFDAWVEQLPTSDAQRTGLAFHYDQPNAEAPQVLLLACHSRPAASTPWSYAELFEILDSTRQMTRLRAFEPDKLQPDPTATSNWPPQYSAQFIGLMGIGDIVSADFDELSVDFGVNNGTASAVSTGGSTGPGGTGGNPWTDDTTVATDLDPALVEEASAAETPRGEISSAEISTSELSVAVSLTPIKTLRREA